MKFVVENRETFLIDLLVYETEDHKWTNKNGYDILSGTIGEKGLITIYFSQYPDGDFTVEMDAEAEVTFKKIQDFYKKLVDVFYVYVSPDDTIPILKWKKVMS